MEQRPKLNANSRVRLVLIVALTLVGAAALAATYPMIFIGPVGGALAGY